MNIGVAAQAAGVSAKMVRHYERIGLLPEATRSTGEYRQYSDRDVATLRVIRQSRSLGFSTLQIRELLSLWTDKTRKSSAVKQLAQEHLADLDAKLQDMLAMKRTLEVLVTACAGDDQAQCAILEGLEQLPSNSHCAHRR